MFLCLLNTIRKQPLPAEQLEIMADSSNDGLIRSSPRLSEVSFITPVFPRRKLRLQEHKKVAPGSPADNQQTWI